MVGPWSNLAIPDIKAGVSCGGKGMGVMVSEEVKVAGTPSLANSREAEGSSAISLMTKF